MSRALRLLPLVVVAAAPAFAACGGGDAASTCGPSSGVVERVVDGDTIELEDGQKIRYLLVDTPESTGGATDCFGQEAAQFNRELVEGKRVDLSYDPAGCEDRFGRTLAYVTIAGRDVNRLLVERGYACVLYIPPPGESRHEEFEAVQAQAKAELRGVWGACEEVTCN